MARNISANNKSKKDSKKFCFQWNLFFIYNYHNLQYSVKKLYIICNKCKFKVRYYYSQLLKNQIYCMNGDIMERLHRFRKCLNFIVRMIWNYKKVYYSYMLIEIINNSILPLIIVFIPGLIIDLLTNHNFRGAIFYAVLFCGATFINETIYFVIGEQKQVAEISINEKMTEALGLKVMNIKYEVLEQKSTLDEYSFALKCIERNSISKLGSVLGTLISSIITLIGVVYIVFSLNISIILLMVVVVIINAIGEVFRLRYVYEREQGESKVSRNLYYARNQLVTKEYAKEIRIYNLSNYISNRVRKYAEDLCKLWEIAAYKSIKAVSWTYIVKGVQLAIVNGYIVILCLKGKISVGEFTIYVSAINTLSGTSLNVVNTFITIVEDSKYIEQLINFLSIITPNGKGISEISKKPIIKFENVSFKYPNRDDYAIKNLSLELIPNKKYAVVGQNGAGKTTFIKLVLGLYTPTSGRILIDGVPQEDIDETTYNQIFSAVFQDFNILGFSLEENIAMDNAIDKEKLEQCINDMGMADKVSSLPQKYQTYMTTEYDSEGMELSGGEKQKLAIARALYKNAEIFILDEPTAALSPQSEFKLYEEFKQITKDKTVIYISHRLSSCRLCDTIFVFENGKLEETGSHYDLMELNGIYANMFNLQANPYNERQV